MRHGSDGQERLDEVPESIGPYRILSILGRGRQGVVYRGRHRDTQQIAAVKTLAVPDPALRWAIRRETRALKQLEHPNIVRILDRGDRGCDPWYAMEFIDGADLLRHCRGDVLARDEQPRPLPADALTRALGLLVEICGALTYLHAEGLVHRDLKPSNILVSESGGPGHPPEMGAGSPSGRPVLVDFGLAQQFARALSRDTLSDLDRGGTLGYMAPEQLRGELADARADLYSLGCLLYVIIVGRLPFHALHEVLDPSRSPPPPSALVGELPSGLDALVLRLLAHNPRDRFAGADIVAQAAARIGGAEGVGAARSASASRPVLYRPGFVGRGRLVEALLSRIGAELSEGVGSLVLVGGESGIGKTRLVLEVARRLRDGGIRIVTGACREQPGTRERALDPLRGVWEAVAEQCRRAGATATRQLLGPEGARLAAYAPTLMELPGAPSDPPELLPPHRARRRLFDALGALLARFARLKPLALVLDDLQWADDLTLGLLEHLLLTGALSSVPVLILATHRDDESARGLDDLMGQRDVRRLSLARFGAPEVHDMLIEMLGGEPPDQLTSRLVEASDGNPLFVAELVRSAVDSGLLVRRLVSSTPQWRWRPLHDDRDAGVGDIEADRLGLPRTLHDLIAGRLGRLPEPARDVIASAAVLGTQVDVEVLCDVCGLDEATLMESVDALLVTSVLTEDSPGRLRFDHHQVQAVAYDIIPVGRRAVLHRRAAEALERRFDSAADRPLAALARHWEAAGERVSARTYTLEAARRAVSRYAFQEAERHYAAYLGLAESSEAERAAARCELARDVLFVLGRTDEAESRFLEALDEAESLGAQTHAAEACEGLGRLYRLSGRPDEAERLWDKALVLERALGRRDREGSLLVEMGRLHHLRGDLERARQATAAALKIHQGLDDPRGQAAAFVNLAMVEQAESSWESMAQLLSLALANFERVGDRLEVGRSHVQLGNARWFQQRLEAAVDHYSTALDLSRELGDKRTTAMALGNLGAIWRTQGRFEQALALCEESLALQREVGGRPNQAVALTQLSTLHRRLGDLAEAARCAREGLRIWEAIGSQRRVARARENLGRILIARGSLDQAEDILAPALSQVDVPDDALGVGRVFGRWAELLLARGRLDEAKHWMVQALRHFRRSEWRGGELEVLIGLARIQIALAELPAARESLSIAAGLADRVGDVLARAQVDLSMAQLARLGGDSERALGSARRAGEVFERLGARLWLGLAHCQLGHIALMRGQSAQAHLERARELCELMSLEPDAELSVSIRQLAAAID